MLQVSELLHQTGRMQSEKVFLRAGIFVLAPCNGYILDKLGYGFVLIVINTLCLLAVVLQSIPVVQLQVRPAILLLRRSNGQQHCLCANHYIVSCRCILHAEYLLPFREAFPPVSILDPRDHQ